MIRIYVPYFMNTSTTNSHVCMRCSTVDAVATGGDRVIAGSPQTYIYFPDAKGWQSLA